MRAVRLALGLLALFALVASLCACAPLAEAAPEAPPAQPRRERIVFCSDRSGEWRIWVMDSDGSGMTQLTRGTPDYADVDPALGPDGAAILFTSTRGGKAGVWRMESDATELERVCDGDQAEWSPDGTRIAFRRDGAVFVRELAGGAEQRLTPADWLRCSGPAWSPDGGRIAFAGLRDGANALYVVEAGGGPPSLVYDKQGACEPHWSPDGQLIAYETETHVCTIKPDGTGNRLITYFGGLQHYPRWSPDGKDLVFCQGASEGGPWEIYVIPSAGGQPRRLTEGGSDLYPDWK